MAVCAASIAGCSSPEVVENEMRVCGTTVSSGRAVPTVYNAWEVSRADAFIDGKFYIRVSPSCTHGSRIQIGSGLTTEKTVQGEDGSPVAIVVSAQPPHSAIDIKRQGNGTYWLTLSKARQS